MWLLVLPWFVVFEGIWLLRHPRTFSGWAVSVWAVISGIGFLVGFKEDSLAAFAIAQIVAVVVYYGIKLHR